MTPRPHPQCAKRERSECHATVSCYIRHDLFGFVQFNPTDFSAYRDESAHTMRIRVLQKNNKDFMEELKTINLRCKCRSKLHAVYTTEEMYPKRVCEPWRICVRTEDEKKRVLESCHGVVSYRMHFRCAGIRRGPAGQWFCSVCK